MGQEETRRLRSAGYQRPIDEAHVSSRSSGKTCDAVNYLAARKRPAKLTEKDVHYIRQLIYEGLGTNEIADHLGVSTANALVSSLCSQAPRTYPARLPIARECSPAPSSQPRRKPHSGR